MNLDNISIDVHLLPGQNQFNGNEFAAAMPSKEAAVFLMTGLISKLVRSSIIPCVFKLFRVSRNWSVWSVCQSHLIQHRYISHEVQGNSAILHCFQITPHRGQWRTEIVGTLATSLFWLSSLLATSFAIYAREAEITNLILLSTWKFVAEVTDCVLLCGMCDLAQWQIDHLCEKSRIINDREKNQQCR